MAGDLRAACTGARVLGVTATPERLDGQGLGEVFDALGVGPTVKELIADGGSRRSSSMRPNVWSISRAPAWSPETTRSVIWRGG